MVEVTADPDSTSILLPELSVGMELLARMPPPTSVIRIVKVPPVELRTVRLSAMSYPIPPIRGIYIEFSAELNAKLRNAELGAVTVMVNGAVTIDPTPSLA